MTHLDQTIAAAYASDGSPEQANKVYLTLLQTILYIPVQKDTPANQEEAFIPLYAAIDEKIFLLGFDTIERLTHWAGDQLDKMSYVELSGHDLMTGISEQAYFALNPGESFHKEFSPDEIKHLKKIIMKIDQLKG